MSKLYNTSFMRRIASSVMESVDNVSLISKNVLLPIETDVPQFLEGSTAAAIEETIAAIRSELISCEKGLSDISEWLRHYADQLDEADEKASKLIQTR